MGRKNNTKKNNKKNNKQSNGRKYNTSSNGKNNNATPRQQQTTAATMTENVPAFHSKQTNGGNGNGGGGGYYDIYKRSTTKFINWMKETLPNCKMNSVNDLTNGVDDLHKRTVESVQGQQDQPASAADVDVDADNSNDQDQDEDCKQLFVAPKHIIDELSKSIRYRQLVTDNRFAAAAVTDEGHSYMIETLRYCRNVLKYGRRIAKVASVIDRQNAKEEEGVTEDRFGNAFAALQIDDDEEEEEEDDTTPTIDVDKIRDGTFQSQPPFKSPETPKSCKEIKIDTLINGDARFQCLALLNTMDDYMRIVHQHYGLLKNHLRGQVILAKHASQSSQTNTNKKDKDNDGDDDGTLKLLMECTVVANMATESIRSAEHLLKINHPHVSSFYHVLTIVFMSDYVVEIEKMLVAQDSDNINYGKFENALKLRYAVIELVAKIVESAFHNNPGYEFNNPKKQPQPRVTDAVKAFTRKFGIKSKMDTLNREFAQPLFFYVMMQTHLTIEKGFHGMPGLESNSWLKHSAYIGGDNSILNTQNLIQKILDVATPRSKLISKAGYWGKQFDEQTNPATCIRGDLDEIFAGCILPEIISFCMKAHLYTIPDSSNLLTLLDVFQRHINEDQKAPVPISVSFSFHAMLTSILVLQGDGDLARIASVTKESYNKLFAQLDVLSKPSNDPPNTPNFYCNVGIYKQLVIFAKPLPVDYKQFQGHAIIDPHLVERFAYWNPLLGGEYMLLCTYLSSIGLGSATIDTMGQLRFTLHLYNALKQRDPSIVGSVPFLDKIDKLFSKTKAVWVGGRPDKGSYAKHFFMSWGHSISNAKQLASQRGDGSMKVFQKALFNKSLTRDLDEILPENYSNSYQSVVQHIFPDDTSVREYTVLNPTKESVEEHGGLYDLLTQVNMTRDSIDEDEDYLSMNLTAVGCILLKFTNKLSKELGWDEIISQILLSEPELRTGKTMGGRKMKEGGFLASDLNMSRQGISYIWGLMLAQFDINGDQSADATKPFGDLNKISNVTKGFFSNIRLEEYIYFVKESELSCKPNRRNPLEGPYPYGRTGLTAQDPLQSYQCFKYNKAGNPDVRLVFPGKLTPFIPDETGFAQTLSGKISGSMLTRLPNGKYRHIASYSLNELIDLGWDGSWYLSTRAKHGVTGQFVPFINGYDSDEDDEYEPIDVEAGKRAGIIGRPIELKGRYAMVRKGFDRPSMVCIN